jgi:hypothetical protein
MILLALFAALHYPVLAQGACTRKVHDTQLSFSSAWVCNVRVYSRLQARIFHESLSRDHQDGSATWQPQGVGSEAHLNGTSQGPTPEDARKDAHIRGRSK